MAGKEQFVPPEEIKEEEKRDANDLLEMSAHFLEDFYYTSGSQLTRKERKNLKDMVETTDDPAASAALDQYEKNMFRVNNLSAALLWVMYAAEVGLLDESFRKREEEIRNVVKESGANQGKPVSPEVVEAVRTLMSDIQQIAKEKSPK